MLRLRPLWFLAVLSVSAAACSSSEDPASSAPLELSIDEQSSWSEIFSDHGATGTFAVREVGADATLVHDAQRATDARIPASTFKILNSLIILETGAASDTDSLFPWDGTDRGIQVWNQDHSLRTGIEVSAVWLYQQLARAVGETAMTDWVGQAGYGNADIGGGIDQFWLTGDLRVSPLQQLDFLERLATDDLPFSSDTTEAVRDIIVRESGDGWTWSHKTGTALSEDPVLGWLVGLTEHDGRTWVFAMNVDLDSTIDVEGQLDPLLRQRLSCRLLVDAQALPEEACSALNP